jgi:hypothetical protein
MICKRKSNQRVESEHVAKAPSLCQWHKILPSRIGNDKPLSAFHFLKNEEMAELIASVHRGNERFQSTVCFWEWERSSHFSTYRRKTLSAEDVLTTHST